MIVRAWLAFAALVTSACAAAQPAPAPTVSANPVEQIAAIEQRTGGRLGVTLLDSQSGQVLTHRADERFAMCSVFKLPLAAMALSSGMSQRAPLPLIQADLLSHSPYAETLLREGHDLRLGFAAQAIVEQSDNAVANILLRRLGGPEALTRWMRGRGDSVTRLDRYELALNENAPGDARDTTSPAAMSHLVGRIVFGDAVSADVRMWVRRWSAASRTGLRRIRAGLPADWLAGDKTGSCGTAYNDVAWFETPGGRRYTLAVFLDRPTVPAAEAEAALADVARIAVTTLGGLQER